MRPMTMSIANNVRYRKWQYVLRTANIVDITTPQTTKLAQCKYLPSVRRRAEVTPGPLDANLRMLICITLATVATQGTLGDTRHQLHLMQISITLVSDAGGDQQ